MIKKSDGFTLIEMIISIAILAIILAIAIPSISFGINDARKSADITNARHIAESLQQVISMDNNVYRADVNTPLEFTAANPMIAEVIAGNEAQTLVDYAVANLQDVPTVSYGQSQGNHFYIELGLTTDITVFVLLDEADPTSKIELYPIPQGEWAN